ncbi:retinoid-inducible serine carboxypeptidase-like [Ruditapes philippinarum]|uniref:retinoid-inducible serine carboxypeptidase-like n=1 Tax=Ruditapes philippinarum TaxID=129788 RepID=UPI00295B2A1F|nr:retinoid-inducible serine carboxypeptidase-like [Ruditapes philippinarum]
MKELVILLTLFVALVSITAEPLKYVRYHAEPQQEWSYVDVHEGAHMFYWLYYTTAPEGFKQAPLVMWLQGGPGGSGTGFGNFEEIGPLDVQQNSRNTTWLQVASLLFVDNPVGTGYSYVDNKDAYTHDVAGIAADMMVTLTTFFMTKSPQFQDVPFYIFSESYGGKMTAAISQALYQAIQAGDIKCNFKGLAMGDSWISPIDSTVTWAPYLYTNSLIDRAGLNSINKSVIIIEQNIHDGKWEDATSNWGATQTIVALTTNGVNFYNILKWGQDETCRLFKGQDSLSSRMLSRLHQDDLAELMNGKIKQKLGIIPDKVVWGGQSSEVFATQSGDFMKPVVDIVDDLIQNTDLEVVVYSGQLDLIVDTIGTEEWVHRLEIAQEFRDAKRSPILDPLTRLTSGYVKKAKNFSFYWILDAGHMVPSDNGDIALKMLKMITQGKK